MKKTVIANVDTAQYKDVDLRKLFDPDHEHEKSFVFQNSTVSSPLDGEGKTFVTFYHLPPGKTNYPYHQHCGAEEVYYIIKGTAILKTPEGERTVGEGDVIVMPANENGAHQLTNPSATETVTYLDVDTYSYPEIVFFPDKGKFRIFTKQGSNSFMLDSAVNYLKDE